MDCDAQLTYSRQLLGVFWGILTRKVDQSDLIFGMRSGFIERSVHTKSLCAAAMICSILVNIQMRTDSILTRLHKKLSQLS